MHAKATHKELKREVNTLEDRRRVDRGFMGWYRLKEAKKLKLRAKEKLNETK